MQNGKSSSYLIANTDHRYRLLVNFHNAVHNFKPDSESEDDEVFFKKCQELADEYKVLLISVDDLGKEEQIKSNFSSIAKKLKLSSKDEENLDKFKNEMLEENDFKELFSDYLRYEFGIQNSSDGGLFYSEPVEGGINVLFAHIDDIRELNNEKREIYLKKLFRKKKYSYVEGETLTSSLKLNFEILSYNDEDIDKLTEEQTSYLLTLLQKKRQKDYEN